MSFEARLMASFRGVSFALEEVEGTSGRRAIPHAYPKRESGWTEDNGKVLSNERITGRVVGDDYLDQLSALLEALNQAGPGEFIHPWFGVRKVQVGNVTHKLVNRIEGTATISFEVFEVGENLFPGSKLDTARQLEQDANAAQQAAEQVFEKSYDVSAIEGIGSMVDQFLDDLDEFTRGLPSLPRELREWTSRLQRAKDSVGKLLAYPGRLAREVMGLLEDVKSVVKDPIRSLDVYNNVERRWQGMRAELAVTGGLSRSIVSEDGRASSVPGIANPQKEAAVLANAEAFKTLALRSAAVGKASAIAQSEYSYSLVDQVEVIGSLSGSERNAIFTGQQLKAIGYLLAARLAELASDAVETQNSALWRSLRSLRQSLLLDTRERAEKLPQLSVYNPSTTVPVALVAWRETGDTENRNAIVRRNGFANPAFILPSQTVEVINE
ncbi:multidrug DMT transporter permease [Vibrio sp. V34_P3A8T189]|uniref:DNA circularization protein n=1 Tax=unclassified Vibrio TaxID=2614977 RepID=UPI001372FD99|nr:MULTISPECIES: DNA circularization N-terminal domain-containing protein [unclassified Vibrio]NAX01433.1 multidrug DMT transporter permease [Vibrio sp. V34_P3A8T189]NAX07212.1 multidrug DMT transporter permease [Vibrio sp. V40_P2S30T141]